ncbi:hypothetical protein [Blastococcus tunisiensis]|uniref:8-amino-7-oxononanoate synthase n=1 Tax=Blastococcus tunisiensis TaxID=1798228 RepID=A0A1I1VVA6_9ACTN|nr:hypothetical protein [Blastococcus sp. DSM 46838]SFD87026.1 7-keto-8-aminopelargonate synthetase [Blastococcus sp. DSM 46838]
MATHEDLLAAVDETFSEGIRRGLLHAHAEDHELDGRHVTLAGRRLRNFGSCSYLGWELDPRMKAAVRDAVDRYGTQFSSSRTYVSSPLYRTAEEELTALFGRPAVITPSTSMGHLAAMPTLVRSSDVLLLDHQVHHSVQTAATLVRAGGAHVALLPHDDLDALEQELVRQGPSRRVWYAADGLYSMYADFLPAQRLDALAARHPNLWLYVDDAHGASWTGRHGRGHALEQLSAETLRRTVVAASLNKSFAAAGGVVTFPDAESRRLVATVGGPLIFSGPVQPPMLGAIVASARLHRGAELPVRQGALRHRIELFNRLAADAGLPLVSPSVAPIRYVGAGTAAVAYRLTERLREAGFLVNTAAFPAVPAKRCGVRLTLTTHLTDDDVADVVTALAQHLPAALADEGSSMADLRRAFGRQLGEEPRPVTRRATATIPAPRPAPADLRLERSRSVDELDGREWDALLGSRGAFDVAGLRTLAAVFGSPDRTRRDRTQDAWDFTHLVVRDGDGTPVVATFFTTARWKDDMLSPAPVSREVERRRAASGDPFFLTSTVVGMGSLLTEGDHLYLDRGRNWRAALRMVLQAARAEEDATGASAVVLRDLPDGDDELHGFLLGEGFLRVPLPVSWVREVDVHDDAAFLAGLTRKQRYHQRTRVLAHEPGFEVTVLAGGSPEAAALPAVERDALYGLYRAVHARALELNVFPLPRAIVDAVLERPGWETVVLRRPALSAAPIAVAVQHVTDEHVAPVFVGLDYRYVAGEHSYQQLLLQALRSAQRRGARRVLYGMGADLQKSRFGARPVTRWTYVQPTETYQSDVLAHLAAGLPTG